MDLIITLPAITDCDRDRVGGKAMALAQMHRQGFRIPDGFCVTADAYRLFLDSDGLRERIQLELTRKRFADMRWEELWDIALRIRNLFLGQAIPAAVRDAISAALRAHGPPAPMVVRSSGLGEDSAGASFAGLHESYVNILGEVAVVEHVRLVWASLWSDRALLYRQELGLDVARSAMPVVVQELVMGECSGVVFSEDPTDPRRCVVEAVHGLNQGLVDGTVAPDRWVLDRHSGALLRHDPAERLAAMTAGPEGTILVPLTAERALQAPLSEAALQDVVALARLAERRFGVPQDVEWTRRQGELFTLQARPITTRAAAAADGSGGGRSWYLGLTRSLENLRQLRRRIEDEAIPAMEREAAALALIDPASLDNAALADAIRHRRERHEAWRKVYWDDFIPFAHGVRLFGQFYNDTVRPDDPFAFMELLAATPLASTDRNRRLAELADRLRGAPALQAALAAAPPGATLPAAVGAALTPELTAALADFEGLYGDQISLAVGDGMAPREALLRLVGALAAGAPPPAATTAASLAERVDAFLETVREDRRAFASDLLDLARASYRLRDDDNVHLGRIEARLAAAVSEGRRRLAERWRRDLAYLDAAQVEAALTDTAPPPVPSAGDATAATPTAAAANPAVRPRQLIGQPAGPGLATGTARVLRRPEDVFQCQAGEIIVCDAIEPTMTFVIPMVAAIVERRGGMLIHGAIIAREYGLPCVTGVPQATTLIAQGTRVTVDGYLGIVTLTTETATAAAAEAPADTGAGAATQA
ncbi:MAG: hypothetical protein GX595_04270 [Lentisphaerae bacterium]|nr:hypothetical protein [Lentisphaerota bacterium]